VSPLIDATHDPALRSWVESANEEGTDFPIQNLPLGRFREAAYWTVARFVAHHTVNGRAHTLRPAAGAGRLAAGTRHRALNGRRCSAG
jgi:fumarylacetoacetase